MYCDFHSHSSTPPPDGCMVLCSADERKFENIQPAPGLFLSLELHPWYLPEKFRLFSERFLYLSGKASAIGEVGLDRLRGPSLEVQKAYFRSAAQLATDLNKPLIIHCVRCWAELQQLNKELNGHSPWILHGFSGNLKRFELLYQQGFYFSLNRRAAQDQEFLVFLASHPEVYDRIGLERDEETSSLPELYQQFPLNSQTLQHNFNAWFLPGKSDI